MAWKDSLKNYAYQNGIAFDQILNTLFNGYADETMSSRAYRAHKNGTRWGKITMPVIDWIFFWQKEHCKKSYNDEQNRKHMNAVFHLAEPAVPPNPLL